ncbi:heparin lyase I family protein [Mariniflexile sp.]|uniref:heparin lyase I family protein n=1 Tax=Mariniflexile sp. TaxID=1979402 RepID=UPI00404811C5
MIKTTATLANLFIFTAFFCNAQQTTLQADGKGNTYGLINNVLAAGKEAVESPDCAHESFGKHITEVWDAELEKYVFQFSIHTTPDNDRCEKFDRQRLEIKTYGPSAENLKGTLGDLITYEWKFKLPKGFQPSTSFTHLHQIKAVGGTDGMPLFTLSAKKGKINKMNLVHDNETIIASANLEDFENVWVQATETIKVGAQGSYSLHIKRIKDGKELLSYSNNNILTIRDDNEFIRPKWGIYRSLKKVEDLRDETLWFADFSITEEMP